MMADLIEGKRAVIEALCGGVPITCIYLLDNVGRDDSIDDIVCKAAQQGIETVSIPKSKLDAMSQRGTHQGVIAEAKPYSYSNLESIINLSKKHARENGGAALIVMLDHITDVGNIGAIARSADALGASGIVLPKDRSAQITSTVYKTSAGAISHIPVAKTTNLRGAIQRVKEEGFWVAGASEQVDGVIWDANLKGKIAIVMGAEDKGISKLVLKNCDFTVQIPMMGNIESLNVAQAFSVCAYEWLRQNIN